MPPSVEDMARACERAAQSSEGARAEWPDQDPHWHTQLENPRCPQTRMTGLPGARVTIRCANLPPPSPLPPSTAGAPKCNPPSLLRAPRSLCRHSFPLSSSLVPLCLAAFLLCSRRSFLTNAPDGPIALITNREPHRPRNHRVYRGLQPATNSDGERPHSGSARVRGSTRAHLFHRRTEGITSIVGFAAVGLLFAATERREPLASRATSRRAS